MIYAIGIILILVGMAFMPTVWIALGVVLIAFGVGFFFSEPYR